MPISFLYPNLISLGGVELSDEGRKPLTENREERGQTIELASGKKRKYIKTIAKTWTIEWDMVAKDATKTIDGKGGRDEIRARAQLGTTQSFVFRDPGGDETYTVFVTDYNETMALRRGSNSYFRVSLTLEEQL